MTTRYSTWQLRPGNRRSARFAAILACLVPLGVVHAQSMPFESTMRGSVGTGLGQQPMARGGTFIPRVDSAVQYAYNLNLVEDSRDRVDTWGLELAPGIYASYLSGSVTAAIDYSLIGRIWGESDLNDVSQIGAANGRWTAVPELFFVDAQGTITQNPINASAGIDYGQIGIFGQDNLSQQATASIAPSLQRQLGQYNFFAQYAYGGVWYFDQGSQADRIGFIGQDNSRNQNATVSFGNQESGRKLTGQLQYDWQKTTYDNALPYNYEQLSLDMSWEVARTIALVGEYGIESDLDKSTTEGGLDSSFWNVGFRWEPDSRTYAEARYGDRFFGNTYFLQRAADGENTGVRGLVFGESGGSVADSQSRRFYAGGASTDCGSWNRFRATEQPALRRQERPRRRDSGRFANASQFAGLSERPGFHRRAAGLADLSI